MGVPVLRTKLRREILAHKGQFAAVSVIVMLGVAVFGAYYDAYLNLGSSYDHIYDRLGFADLTVSGGDTARFAEEARAVPGVAVVENRVVGDVPLRVGGDHELLGRVVGLSAAKSSRINQLQILDGDTVGPDERALLVDQHMADHFDLGPGDRLEVAAPEGFVTLPVKGVVASAEYLWPARSRQDSMPIPDNFGVVYAAGGVARLLTGPAATPEALVLYDDGADTAAVERTLTALAARDGAGTKGIADREASPSATWLQADLSFFGDMAVSLPVIFLVASGVATYVLLARKVRADLPIVGTMLALGLLPPAGGPPVPRLRRRRRAGRRGARRGRRGAPRPSDDLHVRRHPEHPGRPGRVPARHHGGGAGHRPGQRGARRPRPCPHRRSGRARRGRAHRGAAGPGTGEPGRASPPARPPPPHPLEGCTAGRRAQPAPDALHRRRGDHGHRSGGGVVDHARQHPRLVRRREGDGPARRPHRLRRRCLRRASGRSGGDRGNRRGRADGADTGLRRSRTAGATRRSWSATRPGPGCTASGPRTADPASFPPRECWPASRSGTPSASSGATRSVSWSTPATAARPSR